jgi:hypothetical protein
VAYVLSVTGNFQIMVTMKSIIDIVLGPLCDISVQVVVPFYLSLGGLIAVQLKLMSTVFPDAHHTSCLKVFNEACEGYLGSRSSSVSTVTRLRAGRPGFDSRQGRGFFSSPYRADGLWGPPSLLSNLYWGLFRRG